MLAESIDHVEASVVLEHRANFETLTTPIGPLGCPVIIHNKPSTCLSWDFRRGQGFKIGPVLQHYRCFHVVDALTKHLIFSNTVEFLHGYLTQPTVSPADHIVHALNFLSCAIKDVPSSIHQEQLSAISSLRDLFSNWNPSTTLSLPTPDLVPSLPLPVPVLTVQGHPLLPPPRLVPLPRVVPFPRVEPTPRMDHAAPIAPIPTLLSSPKLVLPTTSQLVAH